MLLLLQHLDVYSSHGKIILLQSGKGRRPSNHCIPWTENQPLKPILVPIEG